MPGQGRRLITDGKLKASREHGRRFRNRSSVEIEVSVWSRDVTKLGHSHDDTTLEDTARLTQAVIFVMWCVVPSPASSTRPVTMCGAVRWCAVFCSRRSEFTLCFLRCAVQVLSPSWPSHNSQQPRERALPLSLLVGTRHEPLQRSASTDHRPPTTDH